MGRTTFTIRERAGFALRQIEERGGPDAFPKVLTASDVKPLMGYKWFDAAQQQECLPGMRPVRGGAWRVDREIFVQWLQRIYDYDAINALPATTMEDQWLAVGHVARLLRISEHTVLKWIPQGVFTTRRTCRGLLISSSGIWRKLQHPGIIPVAAKER